MDIDRPSLAAAALYDLKNEQLQLANVALQQQHQHQQQTEAVPKTQETPLNSTAVETSNNGSQEFTGDGLKPIERDQIIEM